MVFGWASVSNIRPLQNAVVARRVVALDDLHSMVLALLVMEVATPMVIAVTVTLTVEHQCLPDPELRNAQFLLYLCVSQRKKRTSSECFCLELASKIMEVDAYMPLRW